MPPKNARKLILCENRDVSLAEELQIYLKITLWSSCKTSNTNLTFPLLEVHIKNPIMLETKDGTRKCWLTPF